MTESPSKFNSLFGCKNLFGLYALLALVALVDGCASVRGSDQIGQQAPPQTTYTLSGTISPAAGGSGATVTLSGAANKTTTANGSGAFSFSNLDNGTYTIAPSNTGYTFSPASQTETINGANIANVNFQASAVANPTYTISGTISPAAGGSGATVTLSGAANKTTTANGSGAYSFSSLADGTYTITPSNTGYTFTPASQTETINGSNIANVNFQASAAVNGTYSISGTISPTAGGSGATITLTGAANESTTANGSGAYTFSNLANGSYTVTPSNAGYTFSPASENETINGASVTGVNFSATAVPPPTPGAPVLFFTDLNSGPATGNSDSTYSANGGVYVTLYGNFLTAPTAVTLNGANCLVVVSQPSTWLWYQRMVVQLTSSCSTGNFVVTTLLGSSNGLPFTVRSGGIYYISASGSDSGSGSFSSPWATFPHAAQTVGTSAGNTVYAENGVVDTADDGQGWAAAMVLRVDWCHGSQASPNAIIGYPGATATLGAESGGAAEAFGSTDETAGGGACPGFWTFANLTLRGPSVATVRGPSTYWRIIGNDMSTGAQGGSDGGAFETVQAANNKILGNNLHDLNVGSTDRLTQGLYLSTDSNHSEVGWNAITNSGGRAGLQVHSSPLCIPSCNGDTTGNIMFDIIIHDNMFSNIAEEAIIMDTEDPSEGPVEAYNNVIWNACQDNISCDGWIYHPMSSDFNTDNGVGSGTAHDFNNTLYCTGNGPCWGSSFEVSNNQALVYDVQNNLIYSTGPSYWSPGISSNDNNCSPNDTPAACPNFAGSNNLVFGAGAPTFTNILTNTINANPLFINLAGANFNLSVGSPATGTGVAVSGLVYDITGKPRPNPPSVGAYEP
jgi:hypothetical protein